MYESAESDIQGAYVGAPCKLICVRKAATAAQLVVARPMGGTTLSAEGQYRGSAMESQEQSPGDVVTAGEDSHPITQAIDTVEVMHAGATAPAANTMDPPTIPLAPMKRMQARFNPLADGLMYVVVFVGGFVGVGCRHALDMLLPSVSGTPFVVGTFVSNMVACFLFAMLTEFMATASWLRRRVRQVVSRGVGLGLLGGLSTMSGVMLETMEGLHERHIASALGYLAGNFAGGLLTAAAGVVLMQALLSRSTRKRVRGAFSAVSVSDSAESDTQGVRHVKVADVARSAAQAAMEAAQAAQQAAQTAADAAALITTLSPALPFALFDRSVSHATELSQLAGRADGTGSASRNANRAADCHPAYADRPRSADSSAGRSSADTVIAAVVARAGYFRLGAAARADSAVATNPAAPAAVAANPAAGQPASTQLRAQTDHCGDFACRRPDYRGGALMMWMICLFGGLGAMARYVLDVSIQRGWNRENRRTNRNFPLSTLVINGVASLCAGIAMMSYYSQSVDMDTVMMFVVGFLGGFSTFSTALNEVVSLIRQRRFTLALGYGIATVAVPLICVAAEAASPDVTLVIAFDQTKPLLKAFASAGVDTKKLYFVAGQSNRFERM